MRYAVVLAALLSLSGCRSDPVLTVDADVEAAVVLLGDPAMPLDDAGRDTWVDKHLRTTHAQAAHLRELGLTKRPDVKADLARLEDLARIHALVSRLPPRPVQIDPAGFEAFYRTVAERYRRPLLARYVQAQIEPGADIEAALGALRAHTGNAKIKGDGFTINVEKRLIERPVSTLDKALYTARTGGIAGPIGPEQRLYFIVRERSGGTVPRLSEVRPRVEKQYLRKLRMDDAEAQRAAADAHCPITLHAAPVEDVFGDACGQALDPRFFRLLQVLSPSFQASEDPEILLDNVRRHYTIPKVRVHGSREKYAEGSAADLAVRAVQRLAADRYLAGLWQREMERITQPDATAVARCVAAAPSPDAPLSLVVAVLDGGDEAQASSTLATYADTTTPLDDLKVKRDGYAIVGATSFTRSQDPALYAKLAGASPGTVIGPLTTSAYGRALFIVRHDERKPAADRADICRAQSVQGRITATLERRRRRVKVTFR